LACGSLHCLPMLQHRLLVSSVVWLWGTNGKKFYKSARYGK
jgi:hypothetical protein